MPRCEGRPDGPCPDNKNDRTVRLSQGDLMLCEGCEQYRFPNIAEQNSKRKTKKAATSVANSTADNGRPVSGAILPATTTSTTTTADAAAAVGVANTQSKLVVNELLAYITYYRNNANADALRRCVINYFTPADIAAAKKLIATEFQSKAAGHPSLIERRNSTTRAVHEAELDDVINFIDYLDQDDSLKSIQFVAADLGRLPKYGPEETNMVFIAERQVKMDSVISQLNDSVNQLKQSFDPISHVSTDNLHEVVKSACSGLHVRMEGFHSSIHSRIDYLNNLCAQIQSKLIDDNRNAPNASDLHEPIDRSYNVVVFGVAEDRQNIVWRQEVDNIFKHIVGREVEVTDTFRLGRYSQGKSRPVLAKLRTQWDRRLILQNAFKLKSYHGRVFVKPDEPIETRRTKTMERMKDKADKEGKVAVINNGILIVDNASVYSMKEGLLTPNNG